MGKYVVRRLLQMVLVLFGASIILFICLFVVPGDPIATSQGEGRQLDPATRAALERRYNLDKPLPQQYAGYLGRLAQGDLGESYVYRRSVNTILREKLGNTARLALAAIALQMAIGILAGIIAAVFRYSFLDVLVTLSTTLAIGVPTFVIGLALQNVFAINLRWLPLQGQAAGGRSIILPALTLAAVDTALVSRLMRGTMSEVMRADYIRTAYAKGLSKRVVILKHALRNSVIPVLTFHGISFGTLLGGGVDHRDGLQLERHRPGLGRGHPVPGQPHRPRGRHLRGGRVRPREPGGRCGLRLPRPADPARVSRS